VYTYRDRTWRDDIKDSTCRYAREVDKMLRHNDTTYASVMYLRDDLKKQYQAQFHLSQEEVDSMTFHDAYDYADAIFAQRFHGYPQHVRWTPAQIQMINTTQIYVLLLPCPPAARKLVISKLLERPLINIIRLATENPEAVKSQINKYSLYSAHDTQIANILR